jgi:hypothetical protein
MEWGPRIYLSPKFSGEADVDIRATFGKLLV